MQIALASLGNPYSDKTWSGTPRHIILALENLGHEVIGIQLNRPTKEPWYFNWKRRFSYRIHKRWFLAEVNKRWLKRISQQLDEEVARINPDIVISICADFVAYTTFKQPVCIIHDTTFASIVDYYADFTNLTKASINAGNAMYRQALTNSKAAVYSARWASESAIQFYGTPQDKVHTIPFGANLDIVPVATEVDRWILNRVESPVCKLLFLGIDWERKGGIEALQTVAKLNQQGIRTTLSIVGCRPIIPKQYKEFVEMIGYLDKNAESDIKRLHSLLENSSALILPSKAECYGCVYCEANAFGLPVIGRDTGGVSEIIRDGINGLLMKRPETPEMLASRWANIWSDKNKYMIMAKGARNEYETRLNYAAFAQKLEQILKSISGKL